MSTPNIFSYATKELSQDAFICWLVACASKATGPLQECGLAFVRALFRADASDGTRDIPVLDSVGSPMAPYNGRCYVSEVSSPRPQYQKIDVYFQAKVDGKMVSFIIEDKVDTEAHSDQLAKYLDAVIEDEQKDLIKPVYFKTGYVFNYEREDVKKNKYFLFETEDLKNFLDCHPNAIRENQILCQYSDYLDEKIKKRTEALANWCLDQDHVQWEFLRKLRRVLRNADGEWQYFVPKKLSGEQEWEKPYWNWNGFWRGDTKGSPWTQYWFSKHLCWRVGSGWPLRLMINLENAEMDYDQIKEYRRLFDKALEQEGLRTGNVGLKKGNECTVGSIEIANETAKFQRMMVCRFLDRVKRVHIRFLERIQRSD